MESESGRNFWVDEMCLPNAVRECQNAFMAIQITIRGVPEGVRDELASRAALKRQSMQEFLRGELERIAARPPREAWLQAVRERKAAAGSRVGTPSILRARDADREFDRLHARKTAGSLHKLLSRSPLNRLEFGGGSVPSPVREVDL